MEEEVEPINEEWSDGKLALLHKEAVIQFILRSPLLLSSAVPSDYAEQLCRPYTPEELEEAIPQDGLPRLLHRLSSISNSSELSFRNSARDSDSEGPSEIGCRNETGAEDGPVGSGFLRNNPQSSFEEMMERVKSVREREENQSDVVLVSKEKLDKSKKVVLPGSDNRIVTLMI